MAAYHQVNNYLNNHYEGMDPKKLILLLYNGALSRLRLTREGIRENDVKKKGENLSKVIAIVSELNASLDPKMTDDSTQFLRSLYTAILEELPKVSLNNDLKTLDRTEAYISKLKEIWEKDVMAKGSAKGIETGSANRQIPPSAFNGNSDTKRFQSISV